MAYIQFKLEDGTIVYIESADGPKGGGGLIPTTRDAKDALEHAAQSFEKSMEGVRKMAASMMNSFREGMVEEPAEVAITFGLKASGELGSMVVARAGMEANYNVSLRWHREPKKDEKGESKEDAKEQKE